MIITTRTANFKKTMNNVIEYSYGFLEGVQSGKKIFLDNIGRGVVQVLGQYIDSEARANSAALHHVYEWYQTGSPQARLFDINYTVSNVGLSINSTLRQSKTLAEDATEPFYNKAKIMENGVPVLIKPKRTALRFTAGGEEIFTRKPVMINNPGGEEVQGSFERTFDQFMRFYFTQGFLRASGIFEYIKKPQVFKKNIKAGSKGGRKVGRNTGFKWIINAKVEVE
jgi:hypothetical protein